MHVCKKSGCKRGWHPAADWYVREREREREEREVTAAHALCVATPIDLDHEVVCSI